MKILVKSDMYDICNRVKKFDVSYRVVYDTVANIYQIYSTRLNQSIELISSTPLSYVCTLPYNTLDVRTIKHLYDTRVENIEELINKIDENNRKLEYQNQLKLKSQSLNIAENRLRQLTK